MTTVDPNDVPGAGTSFENAASTDSGSLTERAAIIRDELLGEDSLEHDTIQPSEASSASSSGDGDRACAKQTNGGNDDELEQRLSNSCIAHSLRHIAMAFDEKVSRCSQLTEEEVCHWQLLTFVLLLTMSLFYFDMFLLQSRELESLRSVSVSSVVVNAYGSSTHSAVRAFPFTVSADT